MVTMYLSNLENFTCPIVQISVYLSVHTVFNATCELIIINQNMKYEILLTLYKFCTCPRTSKLKFSTCPE